MLRGQNNRNPSSHRAEICTLTSNVLSVFVEFYNIWWLQNELNQNQIHNLLYCPSSDPRFVSSFKLLSVLIERDLQLNKDTKAEQM